MRVMACCNRSDQATLGRPLILPRQGIGVHRQIAASLQMTIGLIITIILDLLGALQGKGALSIAVVSA